MVLLEVAPKLPARGFVSGLSRLIEECLQAVEPGMVLEDAAIFIDQNSAALQKPAELKFGWGGEPFLTFPLRMTKTRCIRPGALIYV